MYFIKTVKAFTFDEFIEKKSRFIGYISPCKTIADATEFIEKINKKHYDASHNCYAYKVGEYKKFSDNGEPSGTAGMPILDVIEKKGLSDVCIVVTRYFGGIMLGAGGLVRAYSHAAVLSVEQAEIVEFVPCYKVGIQCDYAMYNSITYIFPNYRLKILDTQYTENIYIEIIINKEDFDKFDKTITDITNGQANISVVEELLENI
ncbi:MAG: YigZ family protein [Oscillospiraceae bacterium]